VTPVEFGLFVVPSAEDPARPLQQVETAERLRLELIGIQDHPYQRRFLDTWTLIAWLAARTSRIRLFPDVANLPLRPPAPLAKAVASLDVLSGGRIELGLGAGAFWDAVEALGGPRRSPGESVEALEEAIQVIRLMWSGQPASFDGRFYSLAGAKPGPVPAHDIGIWIGAYGRRMMRLTGRLADGWLPSVPRLPPEELPDKVRLLEEGASAAGRDPASVRRLANVSGVISDGPTDGFLRGPVDHWVEELLRLNRDFGFSGFVLSPEGEDPEQIDRFASEVAPAVREGI
jgi:alkanesulfonate monooxygenase SsuD/methylene tetrahydromethanopterin reductase-like flavin-dependent oxidoreductase (luciferase family)